jgi:hypothetical protein
VRRFLLRIRRHLDALPLEELDANRLGIVGIPTWKPAAKVSDFTRWRPTPAGSRAGRQRHPHRGEAEIIARLIIRTRRAFTEATTAARSSAAERGGEAHGCRWAS